MTRMFRKYRLSEFIIGRIERLAEEDGCPMSEIVEEAVSMYFVARRNDKYSKPDPTITVGEALASQHD